MELKIVVCPNCGAQIHAIEGRSFMFCEYCGTQIELDDGNLQYEFIDRARVKEAENESKRIDERIRDKELFQQEMAKWYKIRNIWLIALFASLAVALLVGTGTILEDFFSRVFAVVLICGLGVCLIRPKDKENTNQGNTNQEYASQGNVNQRIVNQIYDWQRFYSPPKLPWYYQVGWIVTIGLFTGGIYWIAGPILRILWKNKNL